MLSERKSILMPVTDSAYYKDLRNHCLGNTFLSTKHLVQLHIFEA